MNKARSWLIPVLMLAAVALGVMLFLFAYRYDNKYTAPRPDARNGAAWLDMELYASSPLMYLVDGWEFYRYKLLSPEDISGHVPDAFVYIGQYNGFEMGDANANPHGEGTYRLTVFTDNTLRNYCLELPEIYSAYRVWINGQLMGQMGNIGSKEYLPLTADSLLTFTAANRIEIVVAVSDYTHFYSGMNYPPAFGAPEAVRRLIFLRLLIHSVICAASLFIGVFCLLWGLTRQSSGNLLYLSMLCLCFVIYGGYPIIHNIGLTGEFWYSLERASRQAMTVCLIMLLGRLCAVPRKIYGTMAAVGLPVILLAIHPLVFFDGTAKSLYFVSRIFMGWQWLVVLFLVGAAVWGIWKEGMHPVPLLAGGLIFACALTLDRLYPLYEPILGGWFAETAGFILMLISAGILWQDTAQIYRDGLAWQEQCRFAQARLDMQLETSQLEREYREKTYRLRHEMRKHFSLIQFYLEKQEFSKANRYTASLLEESGEVNAANYTGNQLLNAILASKFARARELNIDVRWELSGIPTELPVEDRILGSLMMNILDNALEACAKVEDPSKRWLELTIRLAHGLLVVDCKNSRSGELLRKAGRFPMIRRKQNGHGYGLAIIWDIAKRCDGLADVDFDADSFSIHVVLNIQDKYSQRT